MPFDQERAKQFGRELIETYGGAMTTLLVDIGHRTGLLAALADGGGTAGEIAGRAGTAHRPTEEWLRGLVTAGVVEHDPGAEAFTLPAEHALFLSGDSFYNTTALAEVATGLGSMAERIAAAVTDGAGIGHDELPDGIEATMGRLSRHRFEDLLLDAYLPPTGMLEQLRAAGGRIADVGCGTGRAAIIMARELPETEVVGLDLSEDAVDAARAAAAAEDVGNVRFEVAEVAAVTGAGPFDLVTAFDVVHDLADPAGALAAIHAAVADGGTFLMYDSNAPGDLAEQQELFWAPLMYGLSVGHCLQVARAGGGEGLGPMWGRGRARAMLAEAGFADVEIHRAAGDPMNALYVCPA